MFSKACEYALKATIYISTRTRAEERASLKDIAREIASPEAFTAKILQQLSRNKIIRSEMGAHGGFKLDEKDAKNIFLSAIVNIFDGDQIYKGCGLGLSDCSEVKPCPLHDQFKEIRGELKNMLENTNIYDLSKKIQNGTTFLKK